MIWRSQLAQIIVLTVLLLSASFASSSGFAITLTEVRLPLGMLLAVAIVYAWLQVRLSPLAAEATSREDVPDASR